MTLLSRVPALAAAATAAALVLPAGASLQAQAQHAAQYHVVATHVLGGTGGWDYLSLDTASHRLFIARGNSVIAVNPTTGALLAEIPGLQRAHGVAFDYALHRGFITSGEDSAVVTFDLNTLRVITRTTAAIDADAIVFDPGSQRVVTLNGDAGSATVIDPRTGQRIANVPLNGKPEFGVSDGRGHVFANIESTSEIVEIDPRALRVVRRWSLAPCTSPSGLAIDVAHQRLFSGCHNRVMAISDIAAGRVVATVPIGSGVDANRFDPGTGDAFSSNGDGTLTVVHEDTPNQFTVVQTVKTMRGARTMELDPRTHRIYTVSARFGPLPPAQPGVRRWPPILPNTFTLLTIAR